MDLKERLTNLREILQQEKVEVIAAQRYANDSERVNYLDGKEEGLMRAIDEIEEMFKQVAVKEAGCTCVVPLLGQRMTEKGRRPRCRICDAVAVDYNGA